MTVGVFDPDGQLDVELGEANSASVDLDAIDSETGPTADSSFEYLVTVGEAALLETFRSEFDGPIVPVDVEAGVPSISNGDLPTALESIAAGDGEMVEVPTIDVRSNGRDFRALMDVMAVTAEPARISEFRTKTGGGAEIDRVRADGIVVSGPAGTPGYGTAVEGPILDPTVGGFSVVPVGQFRTEHPRWVLAPPIEIEIVRETVPIALVVDDREVDEVRVDESIRLAAGAPLEILTVERSEPALAVRRKRD